MSFEAPTTDRPAPKQKIVIDYKNIDDLRRVLTPAPIKKAQMI